MHLSKENAIRIIDSFSIDSLSYGDLSHFFEKEISDFTPLDQIQMDPIHELYVIHNPSRQKRPDLYKNNENCFVCEGKLTRILDLCDLSDGFCFLNKNLYPSTLPSHQSKGMHFLLWLHNHHEKNWDQIQSEDRIQILKRLIQLETILTREKNYVHAFQNLGSLVGGSVVHPHMQILSANLQSKTQKNAAILLEDPFFLQTIPEKLILYENKSVKWIIPPWMSRPYHSLLLIQRHKEDSLQQAGICLGMITKTMKAIFTHLHRQEAWNLLWFFTKDKILVEALPWSQELGGLERFGIFSCQAEPENCADFMRTACATTPLP